MSLRKPLFTIIGLALLAGCHSPAPVQPAAASVQTGTLPGATLVDVGNGAVTPATISLSINLSEVVKYAIQASTPGQAAKTKDDLQAIKFYLIESDLGTAPTALAGAGFTYTVNADNRTANRVDLTFTNVRANGLGKAYYIAVAGFASTSSFVVANNITNVAAPIDDATEGRYYVTSTGGDASYAGSVRVEPVSYDLSGTAALGAGLKLLDAVSPILDADVDVTSGDEITGAPTGSGF